MPSHLQTRRTRLIFETASLVRERGRYRAVVVQAEPEFAILRLKGTRHALHLSWDGIYAFAARCEADRKQREKAALKKGRKNGR